MAMQISVAKLTNNVLYNCIDNGQECIVETTKGNTFKVGRIVGNYAIYSMEDKLLHTAANFSKLKNILRFI